MRNWMRIWMRNSRTIGRSFSAHVHAALPIITAWREGEFQLGSACEALKPDQREMPEGRHWSMLGQPHATVAFRPVRKPAKLEFWPPAKPARDRRKANLEGPARACLSTNVIDQYDFTT